MRAVIFDAFGTLLSIGRSTHPYRQILRAGIAQGRRPRPADIELLMTRPLDLHGAAEHFGIAMSKQELQVIQGALDDELATIEAYPDALQAIDLLRGQGLKVAVCSNLALPYGAAVHRCFPGLDAYALSYAVGATKPDPRIYQEACRQLGVEADQVVMIGDSQRCDRDGPAAVGIRGYYLGRSGGGDYADLLSFALDVV